MSGVDANTIFCCHFDGSDGATGSQDASYAGVNSPHTLIFDGNTQIDTAQSVLVELRYSLMVPTMTYQYRTRQIGYLEQETSRLIFGQFITLYLQRMEIGTHLYHNMAMQTITGIFVQQ